MNGVFLVDREMLPRVFYNNVIKILFFLKKLTVKCNEVSDYDVISKTKVTEQLDSWNV